MADRAEIVEKAESSRLAILENVWLKALDALNKCQDAREIQSLSRAEADARKALEELRSHGRPEGQPREVMHTLASGAQYLRGLRWKVSAPKIMKANHEGLLARDPETGKFAQSALEAYARKHLKPTTGVDRNAVDWVAKKQRHDAEIAEQQARKRKAEADALEGRMIPKEQHELDLAGRALQLRGDFDSLAYDLPLRIAERYGLGTEAIQELRTTIQAAGTEWFGRYASGANGE